MTATRPAGEGLKKDRQWYDYSFCAVPRRGPDIVFLSSWSNGTVDCASGRSTQISGFLCRSQKDTSAAGHQTCRCKMAVSLHLSRFTPQDVEFDGDGVDMEVVDLLYNESSTIEDVEIIDLTS